jgi:hypothetical protein
MTLYKFIVLFSLSYFCFLPTSKSIAATILVEGKCTVPEINSSYDKCLVLNDGNSISILTGRNQSLQYKVVLSNVILSGRLTPEFEENSPLLKSNILKSLADIDTRLADAQASSNVRAFQLKDDNAIRTLIFIGDRQSKNIGEIDRAIPTKSLNMQSGSDIAPEEARIILASFEKEFERCQSLYEALMFEEGDRVLDLTIAKSKLFQNKYLGMNGAGSISNVLKSKIGQLDKLRSYKAYDREIEERQAENNYNAAQKLIAAQERKRREHQYKLAVEYRRSLEATAYRWYNYWGLRYPSNIYIVR